MTQHSHCGRRLRLVDGSPAQDHLQCPAGNLEQHPEQAETGEHRAQLVGLRDSQRRRSRSEEELDGEDERDRLRDLDDQAPAQGTPPQPGHRVTQRMGMTRQGEGCRDSQQRQDRDAHHEADQDREDQRNHQDGQQDQVELQTGDAEQRERQDAFDHALPCVGHIRGHDRVGEGVGQADRLAHHGQGSGGRDHPNSSRGRICLRA
ncbi:hypothetical protein [Streptomyces endophytica]|uniref:Uncharacterized protein n=1 Tax=Streptomyces endophytica TaxID=2991496 RepID=A0ABY6PIX3_9ACTN|nr:hypothetical protein [Streptomyces endophytica]UZJ33453.1 hypothetical protein OJ254_28245 [Streptomyces endophytica]